MNRKLARASRRVGWGDTALSRKPQENRTSARFTVPIAIFTRVLIVAAVGLVIVSYAGQLGVRAFDWHPERDIVSFFNVDRERNLPTSFQSAILLACAVGLAGIAVLKRFAGDRWTRHWGLLAVLFAGLAWDEITEVHERFIEPMRRVFDLQGIFFFGWVIPAGIVVALLGLAYLRFTLALEPATRTRFIVAGVLFLSGALILEGVGGWYYESIDQSTDMIYVTIATIEESLEMAGMILFLHAALTYLSALLPGTYLRLTGGAGQFQIDAVDAESSTPDERREAGVASRRQVR